MKNIIVVLLLMLFSSYSLADEPFNNFNATNIAKAKAGSPAVSKDVNELFSLLMKYAPGKEMKILPAMTVKYGDYVGKIGNVSIAGISAKNNIVYYCNFRLDGKRVENQIVPIMTKIYGAPKILHDDMALSLIKSSASMSGATYTVNNHDFIEYKWEMEGGTIIISANNDLVAEYSDGRRKLEKPAQTKVFFTN